MSRFALFYHSVISDWNHGNAHFLRGMMRALQARGHQVVCYEQADNWSLQHLLEVAPDAIQDFCRDFPDLAFERYALDARFPSWLRSRLAQADVAIVHEWNEPEVINRLGQVCQELGRPALFHDTHYRVVLQPDYRAQLGLERYALILAYSPSVAQRYRELGFSNVHVLHEAADTSVFRPLDVPKSTDVVFVGNYGDGDRSDELEDYVFEPRQALAHLSYDVYGVRYPEAVLRRLRNGLNITYRGWLPNVRVPTYGEWGALQGLGIVNCVHLIPRAHLIAVVPASRDKLLLYPFDVEEALEKSGIKYLLITSQPPASARRGQELTYQIAGKAKAGGLTFQLASGPKGMAVTPQGRLTWSVPPDFADKEADVIVTARDADGQEVFHTFTLAVEDGK